MKADDILGEAAIKTAAYLYTIKGECSPELYQAIATLRQLINEEFDPAKSLSSQFIYDIISPTIAQEANKAAVNALTSYNDWLNAEGRIRSERSNEYHRRIQALTADKESL